MDNLREKAKGYRELKEYDKAAKLYKKILEESEVKNMDKWLGWEYADTLKRLGDIDKSIEICKIIYSYNKSFKYIKNLLAWLLYEKHLKDIKIDSNLNIDELKEICKVGSFILNITVPEISSPYENTIYKIIRILDKTNIKSKNDIIIKWFEKIELESLNREPKKFKLQDQKEIELASSYEELCYIKIKTLYNLKNYNECIINIEGLLNSNIKFHNDRDKWVKRLEYKCKWELGEKEVACEQMALLSRNFNSWVIKYELSKMYIEQLEYDKASYYLALGLLGKEPLEKKKMLLILINDLLKYEESKDELLLVRECIRLINENEFFKLKTLKASLNKICIRLINRNKDRREGIVVKTFNDGKSGFIECKNIRYYFKRKNSYNGIIKVGEKVTFITIKSFDRKKNIDTLEAIEIISIGKRRES